MEKIITSVGVSDILYDFNHYHWKDEPENGLKRIKSRYLFP